MKVTGDAQRLRGGSNMVGAWTPDLNLVDAARAGRIIYNDLDREDFLYLIAVLTHQAWPTDDIAQMVGCSRRLIQQMRHEAICVLTMRVLDLEAKEKKPDHRHCERRINELHQEIGLLKASRGALISQLAEATHPRCP